MDWLSATWQASCIITCTGLCQEQPCAACSSLLPLNSGGASHLLSTASMPLDAVVLPGQAHSPTSWRLLSWPNPDHSCSLCRGDLVVSAILLFPCWPRIGPCHGQRGAFSSSCRPAPSIRLKKAFECCEAHLERGPWSKFQSHA